MLKLSSLTIPGTSLSRRNFLYLGAGALMLAACGSETGSTTPGIASHLNLAFQPPYISVFMMREKKLLEKAFEGHNVDFQYHRLLSLDPVIEALVGGSADLALSGYPFGAVSNGQPLRILALTEHSPKTHAILARPDGKITKVEDLRGKKIGSPFGKNDPLTLSALEKVGIGPDDVTFYKLENNEGRSALLTGAIDVWRTWDPFYATVEVAKEAVPIVTGESYIENFVLLSTRQDYLESSRESIKRFIKAYQEALDIVKNDQAAAIDLFVKENGLTADVAELTFKRREYILEKPSQAFVDDATKQSKFLHELGLIPAIPNWSEIIETEIVDEALAE